MTVQVSEPARLALILYLAGYAVRQQEALQSSFFGLTKPVIVLGVAALLLLLEPDFGAAAVLVATGFVILFTAGARLRDFGVWTTAGVAASTNGARLVTACPPTLVGSAASAPDDTSASIRVVQNSRVFVIIGISVVALSLFRGLRSD